jgi:hypothetical protein
MVAVMLGQPFTAALLASLTFAADGLSLVPLVIVAVVVAYVGRANLIREPAKAVAGSDGKPGAAAGQTGASKRAATAAVGASSAA